MPSEKSIDSVFKGAKRVRSGADLRAQELDHQERNQQLREEYAKKWALVAKIQLCVMLVLILAQGVKACPWKLDDSIMIALLGATSLNTLSVVLAISKGLFNASRS